MTKFLTYLLGFTFCLLVPRAGLACSCNVSHLIGKSEKSQVSYAREHADAVFSGVVTELLIDEGSQTYEAKFRVSSSWKGVDSELVSLFGGTLCCFCQYEFKVGESYVVYANMDKESSRLRTSICHRTRPLAEAAKDLKYLGKSKKAVNQRPQPRHSLQHNNGMHPTADTLLLIFDNRSGRRVMPGVGRLVAERQSQSLMARLLTKEQGRA